MGIQKGSRQIIEFELEEHDLEPLMSAIETENLHEETDFGESVGKEAF